MRLNHNWPSLFLSVLCITALSGCGAHKELVEKTSDNRSIVGAQEACGFQLNKQNHRLTWKHNFPIKLYLGSTFPEELIPPLNNSIKTWDKAFGHKTFIISGTLSAERPNDDLTNGLYMMKDWSGRDPHKQADTMGRSLGNTIAEADVVFDAQYFKFSAGDPAPDETDFESLALHELGHILGFDHSDLPGSVMAPGLALGEIRRTPSGNDLNHLHCAYP